MPTTRLSGFWKRTIAELAQAEPNPAMEEVPDQSTRDYRTRRVVLQSFQAVRYHAHRSAAGRRVPRRSSGCVGAKLIPGYRRLRGIYVISPGLGGKPTRMGSGT